MTDFGVFTWRCGACGSSATDNHFYAAKITEFGLAHRCSPPPRALTQIIRPPLARRRVRVAGSRQVLS